MNKFMPVSLALALAAPFCAMAEPPQNTPAAIKGLRQEIEAMRATYEARLQALEQRLLAAERVAETAQASRSTAAAEPGNISSTAPPSTSQVSAASSSPAGGPNAFNPGISLILSGGYTRSSQDPAAYSITGVQLPRVNNAGPGTRGFSLAESELGLAANVDPWLRGVANISLHPDDTV